MSVISPMRTLMPWFFAHDLALVDDDGDAVTTRASIGNDNGASQAYNIVHHFLVLLFTCTYYLTCTCHIPDTDMYMNMYACMYMYMYM